MILFCCYCISLRPQKLLSFDTKIYNLSINNAILQKDLILLNHWTKQWQLNFNIKKCKVIHYGKRNPEKEYFLDENKQLKISIAEEERDLGISFDKDFNFEKHVQKAVAKANSILGIIKRSFISHEKETILTLYKSLVRPHLEYGNIIWSPFLKRQSLKIERVQRRATKLIPEIANIPYEERLKKLKLPSLKFRRLRGDLIETYKIFQGMYNIEIESILNKAPHNRTRNSLFKILMSHSKTNHLRFSLNNRVAMMWNALTNSTKSAENMNKFKNCLDKETFINEKKYNFDQ